MKSMWSPALIVSGWSAALVVLGWIAPLLLTAQHADSDTDWDRRSAAAALDRRQAWWTTWPTAARDQGTFCVSCHTALPYALARPALRSGLDERAPSPNEVTLLDNVVKRVRLWKEIAPFYPDQTRGIPKTSESRGTEAVLNAVILSSRDARNGAMSDDLRLALANLWALQMQTGELSGAWAWLHFRLEPWEADRSPYFGAALAAVAIGSAPDAYASRADVQGGVSLLRGYLVDRLDRQHTLNRLMLLWASAKLPSLLTADKRDMLVAEVLGRQRGDGGWSTASLGPFERSDGTPQDTESDGYATGLATFALQQAGLPPSHDGVRRGRAWLAGHQDRTTGRWLATSLNRRRDPATDAGQMMGDAATAFAVLALTAQH